MVSHARCEGVWLLPYGFTFAHCWVVKLLPQQADVSGFCQAKQAFLACLSCGVSANFRTCMRMLATLDDNAFFPVPQWFNLFMILVFERFTNTQTLHRNPIIHNSFDEYGDQAWVASLS